LTPPVFFHYLPRDDSSAIPGPIEGSDRLERANLRAVLALAVSLGMVLERKKRMK